MLTTIFTGHTLLLTDIVAIGPILEKTTTVSPLAQQRILYLEISCKNDVTLLYNHAKQILHGDIHPWHEKAFFAERLSLSTAREKLVAQVAEAREISPKPTSSRRKSKNGHSYPVRDQR